MFDILYKKIIKIQYITEYKWSEINALCKKGVEAEMKYAKMLAAITGWWDCEKSVSSSLDIFCISKLLR